jgi:hypothetical protein
MVAAVAVTALLAGCGAPGTPETGPPEATCGTFAAPADVTKPADTCGVSPYTATKPIPSVSWAGYVSMDLYIESLSSCGIGVGGFGAACGFDDNRNFVAAGSVDPGADPSRTRVHITFDFAHASAQLRISPSCRLEVSLPSPPDKRCFAPKRQGEGTDWTISSTTTSSGTDLQVHLAVIQTNYWAPFGLGQVQNDWTLHLDSVHRQLKVSGHGSNFPDWMVSDGSSVLCADQGTHLTALFPPPVLVAGRDYNCTTPLYDRHPPVQSRDPEINAETSADDQWLALLGRTQQEDDGPSGIQTLTLGVARLGTVDGHPLTGSDIATAGSAPPAGDDVVVNFTHQQPAIKTQGLTLVPGYLTISGQVEMAQMTSTVSAGTLTPADVANGVEFSGSVDLRFIARHRTDASSPFSSWSNDEFPVAVQVVNGQATVNLQQNPFNGGALIFPTHDVQLSEHDQCVNNPTCSP